MKSLSLLSAFFFSFTLQASPVLDQVLNIVTALKKGVVIMDLDETTLDSHARMSSAYLAAVKICCGEPETTLLAPKSADCEKLLGLGRGDLYHLVNGYSTTELMTKIGVPMSKLIDDFSKTTLDQYSSGQWLDQDSPMPGANTYVRELKRQGAEVYFISSRYEDTQSEGSIKQLKSLGFLQTGEEDHVILRKRGQSSLEFKIKAVEKVKADSDARQVPVVGLFENEPENINAWKKVFPTATAVLIKGNIVVPAEAGPEVHWVDDYR